MAEMTIENAAELLTARFRAAHKAIETAQDEALELHRAYLKAGRVLGIHPNDTCEAGKDIADAVADLASAQLNAGVAHRLTKELGQAYGLVPDDDDIKPLGGGGGKAWP